MPPHPTPLHPTIAIFKNVRFTGTVFGPQANTCSAYSYNGKGHGSKRAPANMIGIGLVPRMISSPPVDMCGSYCKQLLQCGEVSTCFHLLSRTIKTTLVGVFNPNNKHWSSNYWWISLNIRTRFAAPHPPSNIQRPGSNGFNGSMLSWMKVTSSLNSLAMAEGCRGTTGDLLGEWGDDRNLWIIPSFPSKHH